MHVQLYLCDYGFIFNTIDIAKTVIFPAASLNCILNSGKPEKFVFFPVRCNKKNLSNIHVHQLNTIIYDQFQFKFLSIVNSSEYHTSCYFISFLNHKSRKRNKEKFGHSITYKKILMNTQSPLMFII